MAGFKRVSGGDRGSIRRTISSITVVIGDLLAYSRSAGTVILATSSTSREDLAGVAIEARTTADTDVLLERVMPGDVYEVDAANNSNTAHNYQRMVLTDENTVNNTGTDSTSDAAVFTQTGTVGAASAKKIVGEFTDFMDRA